MWLLLVILFVMILGNEAIKQTQWFINFFSDTLKFRSIPKHLDVVNVGSNSGKYGFDFSEVGLNGLNCAVGPQTIAFDCKILRRVISHVNPGGWAIIPIVPFSSILDEYKSKTANDKYYLILPPNQIPGYSLRTKMRVWLSRFFPIFTWILRPKMFSLLFLRDEILGHACEWNPMNGDALEKDGAGWIEGWKKQFAICELGKPLSEVHSEIMKRNKSILGEMIDLCRNHSVIPILVLPPMTQILLNYLTFEVRQRYIYDFINDIVRTKNVHFFDYTDRTEFLEPDLYFNSFFLNKRGRKLFTSHLISEIKKSGMGNDSDKR